jgi:hypothetical protein
MVLFRYCPNIKTLDNCFFIIYIYLKKKYVNLKIGLRIFNADTQDNYINKLCL